MIERVIDITKRRVKEIMIPKPNIITLELTFTLEKCLNIIIKSAHSRFPVISADKNYVEGFLIAKDLLSYMKNPKKKFFVKDVLRPAIIVPESKYVDDMLKEFKAKRFHIAIVIDEFGVVSGLVTIEDILELIVGDIYDEFDTNEEENVFKINEKNFIVKGFTSIKEFNEKFNTNFKSYNVDTIGGFLTKKIERLPIEGEIISIENLKFEISILNNRHIVQMKVSILNI